MRTWADDWEQRRAGVACLMCAEGRPDVDGERNRRFYTGDVADAYLHRASVAPGYSTVRFRGRHVADISEMTDDERTRFFRELEVVARALNEVFDPCHLNYELLGNFVPHVHAHIVPRYLDDARPHAPLQPWNPQPVADDAFDRQLATLTRACR